MATAATRSSSIDDDDANRDLFNPVESVPNELLVDILARVASCSLTDLCNVKIACKLLHELAEDNHVFRHVSIDRIPAVPWWPLSDEAVCFLQRCHRNNNPEALYRQGMIEFFNKKKFKLGQTLLKRAACCEHKEAMYVLGMILLCGDEESRLQGVEILNKLKQRISQERSRTDAGGISSECRKKCKEMLSRMWVKCSLRRQQQLCKMNCNKIDRRRRQFELFGWDAMDEYSDDAFINCDSCKWDHEFTLFNKKLRNAN